MAKAAETLRKLWRTVVPPRSETSAVGVTMLLAGLVGVVSGLLALGLDRMVWMLNEHLFFGIGDRTVRLPGAWSYLLVCVPPVVFLAVAFAIRRLAPETAGAGIDQVMGEVGRGTGFIRKRVIALKPLFTALCIGAGAPLGMEGPVVQTGAAVGGVAGRAARFGIGNTRVLVAAGAAAALAAKYGAPIGGAVFSAELILGGAGAALLLPLIVASFAAVIARLALVGALPEYDIPELGGFVGTDYLVFVLMGAAAGLVAVYFIKIIFATEDLAGALLEQWWARAIFGGLVVGIAGYLMPDLLRTGRGVVQGLITDPSAPLKLLLVYLLAKPLLCSVALSSGTSGGIFAPALFTGAALGAIAWRLADGALGTSVGPSAGYVLVGMAAVMGATMRAPLQAILITFELTRDYSIIPPLMIACVVSIKVSEIFEPESAFTRRLVRRGIRLANGMDRALLEGFTVADVMDENYVALPADAPIDQVGVMVRGSENRTFPVVDEAGELVGVVTLARLMAGVRESRKGSRPPVRALLEPDGVHLHPDTPLLSAWRIMGNYDYDCLPVCEQGVRRECLVGICEKEAVVELHDQQAFVAAARQ